MKELPYDTEYCDCCDYYLGRVFTLNKQLHYTLLSLKFYPQFEVNEITKIINKLSTMVKGGYFFIEVFDFLYNKVIRRINNLKFKNENIKRQCLNSKTQTFLFLNYK